MMMMSGSEDEVEEVEEADEDSEDNEDGEDEDEEKKAEEPVETNDVMMKMIMKRLQNKRVPSCFGAHDEFVRYIVLKLLFMPSIHTSLPLLITLYPQRAVQTHIPFVYNQ